MSPDEPHPNEMQRERDLRRIQSNAGRCDICGKPIDMSSGDELSIHEMGLPPDYSGKSEMSDQEAADAVARALESVGDSGADYDLANTIREEQSFRAHGKCLDQTAYQKLTEANHD